MLGALAPYGHEAEVEAELVDGADVLDGEDVVRALHEAGGGLVCDGGEGALAGGGKWYAALELALELRGERRAEQGLRRALERLSLAALAAEAEAIHDAESCEQTHAAAGEALRRGERPGQRQLEHEVRAAAGRGLRPGEFGPHRGLPALDKIARHAADHRGVPAHRLPRALEQQRVAVVEGVELRYNAHSPHNRRLLCKKSRFLLRFQPNVDKMCSWIYCAYFTMGEIFLQHKS